ncbi:Na+ dependent nucleoside transporter C-terminus-domain-containing protein, partial [Phakopsora pachyrhizi]
VLVILLLGWWISGLILPQTRHQWVITTFWTWFLLIIIFNCWLPSKLLTQPISKICKKLIMKPLGRLSRWLKILLCSCCLVGLMAGIAFGTPLSAGTSYVDRAISLCGICVFQFGFWITSRNRSLIKWRIVIVGLILQQILALIILKTKSGYDVFNWVANLTTDFLSQGTRAGGFFFSEEVVQKNWFFVNTLSAIIFFVACVELLYYTGLMQVILLKIAWIFFKIMGVSGAEAVVAASSPFVGMAESVLLVKPFVNYMTLSELHQSMASGFATIAGSALSAYVQIGMPAVYLISASAMSIPASLAMSKLRWPEEEQPVTKKNLEIPPQELNHKDTNAMQAFSNGAWLGLKVAGMIMTNVLTVLGLLYTIDGLMTWIGQFWGLDPLGQNPLTMELILQYLLWPVAFLMGVSRGDVLKVSKLLGIKAISNEFVAYKELSRMKPMMSERSFIISTYSLCGFANMGSLGIQIGVMASIAPKRRQDITRVAISSLICGFFSTIQTAGNSTFLLFESPCNKSPLQNGSQS